MSGSSDPVIGSGFVTNFLEERQYFPLVAPICLSISTALTHSTFFDVHLYPCMYIHIYIHTCLSFASMCVFVFVCTCTGKCVYEYLNLYAYVDVHMLTELYLQILS